MVTQAQTTQRMAERGNMTKYILLGKTYVDCETVEEAFEKAGEDPKNWKPVPLGYWKFDIDWVFIKNGGSSSTMFYKDD